MPLVLNQRKLLQVGVHDAPMTEVDRVFARPQKSERRIRLFEKLQAYLAELKKTGWECELIIDGSFVMACVDEPEDIDVVLVLPKSWDMGADLKPYQYNLVSRKRVRKEYGIEVYPAPAGSAAEQGWIDFFGQVNPKWCQKFNWPLDSVKGIVRVVP